MSTAAAGWVLGRELAAPVRIMALMLQGRLLGSSSSQCISASPYTYSRRTGGATLFRASS